MLRAGVDVILVSIGALADRGSRARLREAATLGGDRMILPARAVGGVDLLSALGAAGGLEVPSGAPSRPPPGPGRRRRRCSASPPSAEATVFFTGRARKAASAYPKNANVAATLALAGAGFEDTRVELVADPKAPGNVHEYSVASPFARYTDPDREPAIGRQRQDLGDDGLRRAAGDPQPCGPVAI